MGEREDESIAFDVRYAGRGLARGNLGIWLDWAGCVRNGLIFDYRSQLKQLRLRLHEFEPAAI